MLLGSTIVLVALCSLDDPLGFLCHFGHVASCFAQQNMLACCCQLGAGVFFCTAALVTNSRGVNIMALGSSKHYFCPFLLPIWCQKKCGEQFMLRCVASAHGGIHSA